MNDKTEQTVTDALRGTAAGGHAEIINVPGYPLMVRAVDYNALRAEKDRLTACLEKANINAENFEREWYLRGDEIERRKLPRAQVARPDQSHPGKARAVQHIADGPVAGGEDVGL